METNYITNTNTLILIQTATKLGIKVDLIDPDKLKLRLTKNHQEHTVTYKSFGLNSSTAIQKSRDKEFTNKLLAKHHVPTPKETKITSLNQLKQKKLPPFPLVVKPTTGQKGHHVFAGVKHPTSLRQTASAVIAHYGCALIQEFVDGIDTRFFVLGFKVIGVALRHPPEIVGDGKHTLKKLIKQHNQRLLVDRQKTGKRMQNRIFNWPRTHWHIKNQGLTFDTILPKGKPFTPYPIANFQAGGTVETVPLNSINPKLINLIETIARAIGLTVCGIDMIIKDLHLPPRPSKTLAKGGQNNAVFIEINSDPSLRLHHWPNIGKPQPVASKLLQHIFESNPSSLSSSNHTAHTTSQ